MRETITISLPRKLRRRLDKSAQKQDVNRSDIVREALRRYLFRLEVEEIRRVMVPKARAMGIYTDEDVFRIVS